MQIDININEKIDNNGPALIKTSGKEVRKPREDAGATSVVYTGAIIIAYPTPIPATNRPTIKKAKFVAQPIRKAPAKKIAPAKTIVYLRPIQSEVLPARKEPRREKMLMIPTMISICTSENLRSFFM